MIKKIFNARNFITFVFITFILSVIYVSVRIILAPIVTDEGDTSIRVKSDYILMLLQCIVGVFAMLLPGFLSRRFRLNIPSYMLVIYAVFLFCAIYLGEVRAFYYTVPHWDTILHAFSGSALGALGFSFINLLNKSENVQLQLSPIFVCMFALCFAMALGVVWEIYEFLADGILNTNMQKFALENGEQLIGRAALTDTMKDLIVDTVGALSMSIIGYISLKYKKGWLERLQVKYEK